MVGIAFGLLWFGYSVSLWGWCKAVGYQVGFLELVKPGSSLSWPPPMQPASTSTTATIQPATSSSGGGGQTPPSNPVRNV